MATEYGPRLPVLCQKPSLGRAELQRALTATAAAYLYKPDGKLRSIHRGKIDLAALGVQRQLCNNSVRGPKGNQPPLFTLYFLRTTDTLSPFCAISSREIMTRQTTAVMAERYGGRGVRVKCTAGDVAARLASGFDVGVQIRKKRNTSCDFVRILFWNLFPTRKGR